MQTDIHQREPLCTCCDVHRDHAQKPYGSIKLIIGCMFSNKTMTLINSVGRYRYAGRRCVIVKHAIDVRYDHIAMRGGIVCNNGMEYTAIPIIITNTLASVDTSKYDVIGVTESQFFDDLLIVDGWANSGIIVICDGLDGTFNRDNFGRLHELIPKCEDVIKLNAVCIYCGNNAAFTKKIGAPADHIIEIGGSDKYRPVCRKCYFEENTAAAH